MEGKNELELTVDEFVQLLNIIRDETVINVVFDKEGGDPDAGKEEVSA